MNCPVKVGTFCQILNIDVDPFYDRTARNAQCPLVDLGSHGDLIDRDALSLRGKLKLIKECEIQIYGGASWDFAGKCIAAIEDAPTIIEAEGAKE